MTSAFHQNCGLVNPEPSFFTGCPQPPRMLGMAVGVACCSLSLPRTIHGNTESCTVRFGSQDGESAICIAAAVLWPPLIYLLLHNNQHFFPLCNIGPSGTIIFSWHVWVGFFPYLFCDKPHFRPCSQVLL